MKRFVGLNVVAVLVQHGADRWWMVAAFLAWLLSLVWGAAWK